MPIKKFDFTAFIEHYELFSDFIDDLPMGIIAIDENNIIKHTNDYFAKLMHCEKIDIVDKNLSNFILPISMEKLMRYLEDSQSINTEEIERNEEDVNFHLNLQSPSGIVTTVNFTVFCIQNKMDNRKKYFIFMTEVPDSQYAREQLIIQRDLAIDLLKPLDSLELFEKCLNAAIKAARMDSGGIYMLDIPRGKLNLIFHQGFSEEFIEQVKTYDINTPFIQTLKVKKIHFEDYPEVIKNHGKHVLTEGLKTIAIFPIFNETEEIIGVINIASHSRESISPEDKNSLEIIVTHIAHAFNQLIVEEKLITSELIFKNVIQQATEGIIIINQEGNIIEWNDSLRKIFDLTRDEAIGRKIWDIQYSLIAENKRPPNYLEYLKNKFFIKSNTPNYHQIEPIVNLTFKDGSNHFIEENTFIVKLKNEKIICSILNDVTNKKKSDEEKIKNQRIESLGVLAGGIAHDFNNLLTSILGNASLIKIDTENNPEIQDHLKEISHATELAINLTHQLLTFAKGGAPIKEMASIEDIVKDSADFVLKGSSIKVEYNIPYKLWQVNVDKHQISQVIQNIVLNAKEAMENIENGKLSIKMENVELESNQSVVLNPGKYIKISFEDNGLGISKEDIGKIFDPYFTTKPNGTGLGLAICHSIINKHNGVITVKSEEGKGTTFTIYIGGAFKERKMTKSDSNSEIIKENMEKPAIKSVLVLEDNPIVSKTLNSMLKKLNIASFFVETGLEAIEQYQNRFIKNEKFDLVILDLVIPGSYGGETTMKKLLEIDPNVKAIVSSGYATQEILGNYEEYGFVGILPKPYTIEDLKKILFSI